MTEDETYPDDDAMLNGWDKALITLAIIVLIIIGFLMGWGVRGLVQ